MVRTRASNSHMLLNGTSLLWRMALFLWSQLFLASAYISITSHRENEVCAGPLRVWQARVPVPASQGCPGQQPAFSALTLAMCWDISAPSSTCPSSASNPNDGPPMEVCRGGVLYEAVHPESTLQPSLQQLLRITWLEMLALSCYESISR